VVVQFGKQKVWKALFRSALDQTTFIHTHKVVARCCAASDHPGAWTDRPAGRPAFLDLTNSTAATAEQLWRPQTLTGTQLNCTLCWRNVSFIFTSHMCSKSGGCHQELVSKPRCPNPIKMLLEVVFHFRPWLHRLGHSSSWGSEYRSRYG